MVHYAGRKKKKHFFHCPIQLVTILEPERCFEPDGVFRFSNFVLFFPLIYVEIRKITLFIHIATAVTHFLCFNLHECHITNVYVVLDIPPMQKFLKIHCLHWVKTPFLLEHGCFNAVNMGSG